MTIHKICKKCGKIGHKRDMVTKVDVSIIVIMGEPQKNYITNWYHPECIEEVK